MTQSLRGWIMGIAGAGMITAIVMTVAPEGKVKKIVALVCGLMTVIALIKPIKGFDYASFANYLSRYKNDAAAFSSNIESENENLKRRIIEDKYQAYILDKGKSLGITDLCVTVTAEWSKDGYWYPGGASLMTNTVGETRDKLSHVIEADLGIPPEELIWSMSDEE